MANVPSVPGKSKVCMTGDTKNHYEDYYYFYTFPINLIVIVMF